MEVLELVNRTKAPLEFMFNSVPYVVGGGKSKTLPADAAMHGYQKAIARLDPITGEALFLFGVKDDEGNELRDCSPLDYVRGKTEELLDRSNMEGNFQEVVFNNPDSQKARVTPVQLSGSFSDLTKSGTDELRAPELREVKDGEN